VKLASSESSVKLSVFGRAVGECKLRCNSAKTQEYSVRKSWINIIMQHVLLNYHDVHEKESKNETAWDK
jgi:hypothetical protein